MGHKPSATAEKHYTVRPLDLLRVHHERIEAWILEQAGIVFDAKAAYLSRQGPVMVLLLCGSDKGDQGKAINQAIEFLNDWKQRGKP
jgi:hypothetical protein